MIDFACKQFNLNDIVKCGLGLTKSEFKVMQYFWGHKNECMTANISEKLGLKLTTVQKAVKKLSDKGVIVRHQKNLSGGGYVYTYECNSKERIRLVLKGIISNWSKMVNAEIDKW
ncbi:MAG: BlaI/MecI/CopY family transcriptional regulator [Nanoarchaeota archaeon]|nr:BlaI/MecI/CopY family transcriptional regulator [Nanoarchaeota archaeon]